MSAWARDLTGAVCKPWAGGAEEAAGELEQMLCQAAGLCKRAEPESREETGSDWHVRAGRLEAARRWECCL